MNNISSSTQQRRWHFRPFKMRSIVMLLLIAAAILSPQTASAGDLTKDDFVQNATWNPTYGRIEFKIYYAQSATRYLMGLMPPYFATLTIDGVHIGNFIGAAGGCQYMTFVLTSPDYNGKLSVAGGAEAEVCGLFWSNPEIPVNYGTTRYLYRFVADASGDYYAQFYYYVGNLDRDRNISIKVEGYATGATGVRSTTKTVDVNRPAFTVNPSLTGGTIQNGSNISFNFNASSSFTGGTYLVELMKRTNVQTNAYSTVESSSGLGSKTFSGRYLTTADEYKNSVPFKYRIRCPVSGGKTTYWWEPGSPTNSQRTGILSSTSPLSAVHENCGKINLKWYVQHPDGGSSSSDNRQGFDLQVKKNNGNWTNITTSSNKIDYNPSQSEHGYTYDLPAGDMNSGNVNYEFRIKREFADWDDNTLGNASQLVYNPFQQNNKSLNNFNTNYKSLKDCKISTKDGDYPLLEWDLDNGVDCADKAKLYVRVGGALATKVDITSSLYSKKYQIESGIGAVSCQEQSYELILEYTGTTYSKTYLVDGKYAFEIDAKRQIDRIEVSKGYYPNSVNIKWSMPQDYDNFSTFRLLRKRVSEPETSYGEIYTVSHSGVLNYNFDDVNVEAGAYYNYKVEGIYQCQGKTTPSKEYSPVSVGFSQPFGSLSGRITYTGS